MLIVKGTLLVKSLANANDRVGFRKIATRLELPKSSPVSLLSWIGWGGGGVRLSTNN